MEPFKLLLGEARIREAGHHLQRAWPGFDRRVFEQRALAGLDALELKARAMHIADALDATLPADFAAAAAVLEASLGPPLALADGVASAAPDATGLAGWIIWPIGEFVARRGLQAPERALRCLRALTQRHTAEWAIRPFIAHHPALTFATLQAWTRDPSEHVRRLASEGSRPRLPWGVQLKSLIADPTPTLPLLEALQDYPSDYVRRSVANHLNDIAKDHPGLVADWVARHLPGAAPQRRALLRHACRTLIKAGDARVMDLWGVAAAFEGRCTLALTPKRLRLGETLSLAVDLHSSAHAPQALVIDYAVHHVKANGDRSPKVFKGWTLELVPGQTRALIKRHAIRPITTRRYYPGAHAVDLRINGSVVAQAEFHLQMA